MSGIIDILIVDDEQTIRDGLKNMLDWKAIGFRIVGEASNGRVALQQIERLQPQIVITDLKMPEMDGLELTNQIAHRYPKIQFLILSSYDDFDLVSQSFRNGAVDYLLKPTVKPANLVPLLKKMAARIQGANNQDNESDDLNQELNRVLAGFGEPEWVRFDEYFGPKAQLTFIYSKNAWTENAPSLKQVLAKLAGENHSVKCLQFEMTNGDFGLLIGYQSALELAEVIEQLRQLVNYDQRAFLVIGTAFEKITQILKAFNSVSEHSKGQSFYFKGQPVITEGELYHLGDGENFDTKKFIRALLDNDFKLGLTRIEDYLNQMILAYTEPVILKQQTSSIFYTLISSLEDAFPEKTLFANLKQVFFVRLNDADYLEDFSNQVLTTLRQIREELEKDNSFKTEDELLKDLKRYIRENYRQNLSLSQLAQHFHFSYNYLSSLFSQTFSQTFSEYLNKIRLEEAKRLLVHSDKNLSEIADDCGYSDLSYFSKIFKKEFGTTPSKYRRDNRL